MVLLSPGDVLRTISLCISIVVALIALPDVLTFSLAFVASRTTATNPVVPYHLATTLIDVSRGMCYQAYPAWQMRPLLASGYLCSRTTEGASSSVAILAYHSDSVIIPPMVIPTTITVEDEDFQLRFGAVDVGIIQRGSLSSSTGIMTTKASTDYRKTARSSGVMSLVSRFIEAVILAALHAYRLLIWRTIAFGTTVVRSGFDVVRFLLTIAYQQSLVLCALLTPLFTPRVMRSNRLRRCWSSLTQSRPPSTSGATWKLAKACIGFVAPVAALVVFWILSHLGSFSFWLFNTVVQWLSPPPPVLGNVGSTRMDLSDMEEISSSSDEAEDTKRAPGDFPRTHPEEHRAPVQAIVPQQVHPRAFTRGRLGAPKPVQGQEKRARFTETLAEMKAEWKEATSLPQHETSRSEAYQYGGGYVAAGLPSAVATARRGVFQTSPPSKTPLALPPLAKTNDAIRSYLYQPIRSQLSPSKMEMDRRLAASRTARAEAACWAEIRARNTVTTTPTHEPATSSQPATPELPELVGDSASPNGTSPVAAPLTPETYRSREGPRPTRDQGSRPEEADGTSQQIENGVAGPKRGAVEPVCASPPTPTSLGRKDEMEGVLRTKTGRAGRTRCMSGVVLTGCGQPSDIEMEDVFQSSAVPTICEPSPMVAEYHQQTLSTSSAFDALPWGPAPQATAAHQLPWGLPPQPMSTCNGISWTAPQQTISAFDRIPWGAYVPVVQQQSASASHQLPWGWSPPQFEELPSYPIAGFGFPTTHCEMEIQYSSAPSHTSDMEVEPTLQSWPSQQSPIPEIEMDGGPENTYLHESNMADIPVQGQECSMDSLCAALGSAFNQPVTQDGPMVSAATSQPSLSLLSPPPSLPPKPLTRRRGIPVIGSAPSVFAPPVSGARQSPTRGPTSRSTSSMSAETRVKLQRQKNERCQSKVTLEDLLSVTAPKALAFDEVDRAFFAEWVTNHGSI